MIEMKETFFIRSYLLIHFGSLDYIYIFLIIRANHHRTGSPTPTNTNKWEEGTGVVVQPTMTHYTHVCFFFNGKCY